MELLRQPHTVPGWGSYMDRGCQLWWRALQMPGHRAAWAGPGWAACPPTQGSRGYRPAQPCSQAFVLGLEILLWQLPDTEKTWEDVPSLHLHQDKGPKGRKGLFPLPSLALPESLILRSWLFHRIGVLQSILKTWNHVLSVYLCYQKM